MARLILATAEGQQAIDLRPINSLGRHPNNTIQLLDKIVSKEHCILELRDGQFILRDLGSLNGTYVNGERVRGEQGLRHGDEITLGSTRARFDDGSGIPLPPPPIGPGAVAHPPPASPGASSQQWGAPASSTPMGGMPQPAHGHGSPPMHGSGAHGAAQMHGSAPGSGGAVPSTQSPGMAGHGVPSPASGGPRPAQHAGPPSTGASAYGAPPQPGGGMMHLPPSASPFAQGGGGPSPASSGGHGAPHGHGAGAPPQAAPPPRPRQPLLGGTRVDMLDSARSIGTQIAAHTKGFLPFEQTVHDPQQLRLDYERLRITWELTRDIGLERDLEKLLEKILLAIFKFVNADRGVILLDEGGGKLNPRAARRRDGTDAPIQVSSTILNHVIKEKASVLTHDASMDFAASKGKSMILNRISSAIVVPLLHERDVLGAIWLDSESLAQFQPKDLEIITALANQAAMFIENIVLAKKIEQEIVTRERFSRLLSPNVAEQVISGRLEIKKGGVLVPECTVFNSDIRGFTRMSEGAEPDVMLDMLNQYFEEMVETIFKYEGTLDKFMGDGIMALWGAPATHPDDPVRSVMCALDQMEILGRLNQRLMETMGATLGIGIGIHTGPLVAGYVGSSKALSYTVIGATANTSARICGIAEAGQILVTESTMARLGNRFEVDEMPPANLKGIARPVRVFNVKRERPTAASAARP